MYVLSDGVLEVRKDNRILKVINEGEVFGELAILYHCKRTASVMTREKCRIWRWVTAELTDSMSSNFKFLE